ncbi:MAG: hypothetical protein K2X27_23460 [Candidatus Obscuribacterales bacterium]|nr:hypothetical protein [Candidatus Obscuribacterales bacterium]
MSHKEIESSKSRSAEKSSESAKADASNLLCKELITDSTANQGFMKILNELAQKNQAMTEALLGQVKIDFPQIASLPVPKMELSMPVQEQKPTSESRGQKEAEQSKPEQSKPEQNKPEQSKPEKSKPTVPSSVSVSLDSMK